ncbi:MAG: MlaD family protein [Deltaproteobacteria bacterium]|jgi:paraquat-inducible protein B|nr:MlaD family protein [Deltaproteobacteria bacterium]
MTKKANPKLIGAFVVGAVVLATIGVIVFGSGKFFEEKHRWVLFFPGSVKGLTTGAPVTLKGVQVGTVTDVKVVIDRETVTFQTPVYVEVLPDRVKDIGEYSPAEKNRIAADPDESMKLLVERGLRAKLELQSLVTGKLQVAFDMYPDTPVNMVGLDKKVPELPTIPMAMEQLAKTLENLPIQEIVEDARKTMAAIEKLATSPELTEAVTALNNTLQDVGKLARNLDGRVGPLSTSIEGTMKDTQKLVQNVNAQVEPTFADLQETLKTAQTAMKKAEVALTSVSDVVDADSTLMYELTSAIKELQVMAQSINALAGYLQRQPDSLIRGKVSLGR